MRRSRRVSRGLIAVLSLALLVSSVCVYIQTRHGPAHIAVPTLSALDVSKPPVAPANSAPVISPIQTTTPDPTTALASTASDTTTPATPHVQPAPNAQSNWSQLLTTGTPAAPAVSPSTLPATNNDPLTDGKARLDSGQLIEARSILNAALQSDRLKPADADAARAMLRQINQTLVFSPKVFANDPFCERYAVKSGDSLARIAAAYDSTWELLSRINHLDPRRLRYGSSIKVIHGPFFARVCKKSFTMDLYLGGLPGDKSSMYITSVPVGLGKDDSTPTGLWAIGPHAKLKHPTYYPPEGGTPIDADDPTNPLGGFWIALTGVDGDAVGRSSYGIHGTIDPASIGHQSSMGCIRLGHDDITLVFELLVEGKSMVRVES